MLPNFEANASAKIMSKRLGKHIKQKNNTAEDFSYHQNILEFLHFKIKKHRMRRKLTE